MVYPKPAVTQDHPSNINIILQKYSQKQYKQLFNIKNCANFKVMNVLYKRFFIALSAIVAKHVPEEETVVDDFINRASGKLSFSYGFYSTEIRKE